MRLVKDILLTFILYRADLSGADLRSIYFPTRTNYVNLRNANLSGADLWPARFIGCDLSGANLSSTHLAATKFIGCDLRGANIENVLSDHILEFIEVNLQGAKLTKFDSEQLLQRYLARWHFQRRVGVQGKRILFLECLLIKVRAPLLSFKNLKPLLGNFYSI